MSDNFNQPYGANPPIIPPIDPAVSHDQKAHNEDQSRNDYREEGIADNTNLSHRYKALLHIKNSDKWKEALGSATALYDSLGHKSIHLIFIVTDAAVKTLIDKEKNNTDIVDSLKASLAHNNDDLATDILGLYNSGSEFIVCAHSLAEYNIDAAKLFSFVSTVPHGAVELVSKQNSGYSYLVF
ncbi:MAG: DsrE family protein [Clostridiaceae bacterium]